MKKKLKSLAELLREASKQYPKEEWQCETCGHINTSWFPDIEYMMKANKIKFKKSMCSKCRELEDKRSKAMDKRIEESKTKENIKRIITHSQVPPKILASTFEKLNVSKGSEKAFKVFRKLDKADRWIYLTGDNSTGKTMITGAAVNDLSKKLIPSYYFNERHLFRRLKDTYNNSSETEKDIFDSIKESKIIFWDDFSTLQYTTWQKGIVYDILEYCETYYKIIIFISNVDLEKAFTKNKSNIEDRIGKRI
ncbi:MAG: hypothetical protein K9L62_16730, partial [Vallitaleaceae bacterium]|nr:hypothetical protein [Vallitaleaceae bacterium]